MAKEKKEYYPSYQPQAQQSRFWIGAESCYTEKELEQRAWILKTRANSGIHPDYLINPGSWFAEDSQALINVYEHSWFFSNGFKTRQTVTRDDFYVQPIESQRLQWPALYDLMQKTGDYLLLRNQELSAEHLNQPMNFFFLDLNHILKGIAQNPNIKQTKDQLGLLNRYVRSIEKNIPPFSGSDRLFLANYRSVIDLEIQPQLTHKIESQLLKDRLDELSKTIGQLSTERNRVLHFALNTNLVNPHPYGFTLAKPHDIKAYPTLAIRECQHSSTELSNNFMPALAVSVKQLKECPDFNLINMEDEVLSHYAKAITDLNQLNHFHRVILQTIDLLGQAGEVYTVFQFKEQLSLLLKEIDYFIEESAFPIEQIIHENTLAYHKAIQEQQKLSFIKKWLSSERETISRFIENQDTLAQYPSTHTELGKTNYAMKHQANQILEHLNDPKIKGSDFATLAGKAQELNNLMDSIHGWVKVQYELKGLMPPEKPIQLKLLPPPKNNIQLHSPSQHHLFFHAKQNNMDIDVPLDLQGVSNHHHSMTLLPRLSPPADQCLIDQPYKENTSEYINLLATIPLGLLALYLIYQFLTKTRTKTFISGDKQEYEKISTELEDCIVQIQQNVDVNDLDLCETLIDTYQQLKVQANHGVYHIEQLKHLYEDFQHFYDERVIYPQ